MQTTTQVLEYDVVIMGAGFAGLCQARHLMLNIPNIRITLIDPRPEQRLSDKKNHKLGESLVEIGSLFLYKELDLYEYIIENHPPKAGLHHHWAKDSGKTENIDDYFNIWVNRQGAIPTFHLHRARFEEDLLQMNKKQGAVFYQGKVIDVDLTPGDALKTVKVKKSDGEYLELKTKHVIDAAGRKFIIGRKTDNVLFGPENLDGVNNGSAWISVKNVDRDIISKFDPTEVVASRYYATNHWFGEGHWIWMIPNDTKTMELSLGIVHHHDVISSKQINTLDKFLAFLEVNHNILYKLVKSGADVEFNYLPRLAHISKTMFSKDNWYVLGDSAAIFDAFYGLGTTMIAQAAESITEIIKAKLAGDPDAESKRSAYNDFNVMYARNCNKIMSCHSQHVGHASVMSSRIYLEYMWWFGLFVPMYIGKWFLDPTFISAYLKSSPGNFKFFTYVYQQLTKIVEKGGNIGLMDCYRSDQLIGGYYTGKHFDDFLENAKLAPGQVNIFAGLKNTAFYTVIWLLRMQWKGFGISGVLAPKNLFHIARMLMMAGQASLGDMAFHFQTKDLPTNQQVAQTREEFKSYRYQAKLLPWGNQV